MANTKRIPFSVRNGYTKPSDVLIIDNVPVDVSNAIGSALFRVVQEFESEDYLIIGDIKASEKLFQFIWSHFWHKSIVSIPPSWKMCVKEVINWLIDPCVQWYEKNDFIEFIINHLADNKPIRRRFIEELNDQFENLNFGYRIVDNVVVDIVAKGEIESIEDAINDSLDQVSGHLKNALALHTKRPNPDYANSIKEAISAVEAQLRHMTGENTLGDALKKLQKSTMKIHPILKN